MDHPVIQNISDLYYDNIKFLFLQRESIIRGCDYSLHDLLEYDNRVDANFEGLKVSGQAGWELCSESLNPGQGETAFPLAFCAFASDREEWINKVVALAEQSDQSIRPIVASLGWIDGNKARAEVQKFLNSDNPAHQKIAVGASSILRLDIGPELLKFLTATDPFLRARALRMAGELGRKDCLWQLQSALEDSDESCRFWAAWSLALLGDRSNSSTSVLADFVENIGLYADKAASIAGRTLNHASIRTLHKRLADSEKTSRLAIKLSGACGDPALVFWLIEQMSKPEMARLAGDAFTMITGAKIIDTEFEGIRPEGFQSGPTDDPEDPNVEMNQDEFLPWPDQDRVKSWWEGKKNAFNNGVRYLMGQPINEENLNQVLMAGTQNIRNAAAIEKSILTPCHSLFNTSAPAWRQMREIENMNGASNTAISQKTNQHN